jgi:hypothetical protein
MSRNEWEMNWASVKALIFVYGFLRNLPFSIEAIVDDWSVRSED